MEKATYPPAHFRPRRPSGAASPDASAGQQKDSSSSLSASELTSLVEGANVFVLFDTSNYMYRGFVFAQDAIADFVRSLESADKVAFYSYSRDLSRAALLTADRAQVLRAARTTVAGDDAALYNCLLLTVQDAAHFTGRKVIVVFSNGPDNYSMVPPEDVAELAQSTGTTIYMVSTQEAHLEPISNAVFQRMTAATGGKVYFAQKLEGRTERLRFHPRRSSASLFAQLLPQAQSQPRLAHHHRKTRERPAQALPHSHARRLSPATLPLLRGIRFRPLRPKRPPIAQVCAVRTVARAPELRQLRGRVFVVDARTFLPDARVKFVVSYELHGPDADQPTRGTRLDLSS